MVSVAKSGNTTLIFNDDMAVQTQEEIDAILDDIAVCATRDIINAAIKKMMQEKEIEA